MIAAPLSAGVRFSTSGSLRKGDIVRAKKLSLSLPRCASSFMAPSHSAKELAAALSLTASTEPALAEADYGAWTGKTLDHILREDPSGIARWMSDPEACPGGGTSLAKLCDSVGHWMERLVTGSSGTIIAVSHVGPARAAIVNAIGGTPSIGLRIDVTPLKPVLLTHDTNRWAWRSAGPET